MTMGRASRAKRERRINTEIKAAALRNSNFQPLPFQTMRYESGSDRRQREILEGTGKTGQIGDEIFANKHVYRFFQEKDHADALVEGKVWLSTLTKCRGYEDQFQGDSGEGTMHYQSGTISGSSHDKDFVEMARHANIGVGNDNKNIQIIDCSADHIIPDAFVICTTEHFSPDNIGEKFGKYCVEISNPKLFFELVTENIKKYQKMYQGAWGRIIYKERKFSGRDKIPGPMGFVKPPDKYSDQREVRFIWTIQGSPLLLEPFGLNIPEVKHLCRRIDNTIY